MMPAMSAELELHHEEATFLWLQRCDALQAPNYSPQQFADLDERLAAHLDGLRIAGTAGWRLCEQGLTNEGADDFFPAAVLALEQRDARWDDLLERTTAAPEAAPGLASALGWSAPSTLNGVVKDLLRGASPLQQRLGVAACAMHRQDPGPALDVLLASSAESVRARALRAAGELGRHDTLPAVLAQLTAPRPETRYWAAWSACLLGAGERAMPVLTALALKPGLWQMPALQFALLALDAAGAHALLVETEGLPEAERLRIIGCGRSGNPRYVPWLIEQMEHPATARIAGEAFAWITGADFNLDQLEAMPPEGFEDGPTDDPEDEGVEVPEDIALPWPDVPRIKAWWSEHQGRFAADQKLFFGQPLAPRHCQHVLKAGMQRYRVAAAQLLAMLQTGSPLFPTAAPAWRQQRAMEAWPA